jgi:molybdopterin molybdotransferase
MQLTWNVGNHLKTRIHLHVWGKKLASAASQSFVGPTALNITKTTLLCAKPDPSGSLSVVQTRALILDALSPVAGHELLPIRQALGRVLAADVISALDVPAHDNSAMDGFAVNFADLVNDGLTRLHIVGTALAGVPFTGKVGAGGTARIMTGAVMPAGADTVVMQEVAHMEGDVVNIPDGQRKGQHVRRAGEDLRAGTAAIQAGKRLGPAELGVIASLGCAEVSVRRRVRVAMFSTGDELCSIGMPLAPGAVYDSNRYSLWGMLSRLGCEIIDMGVVKDDPLALENAFRDAAACADVIITSGGVSVGEADFIKSLMAQLGEVMFWKIAMKPGRPMAFGQIRSGGDQSSGAWLFGLPGNPVAVMVTFYQFVRPALLKLAGVTNADTLPEFSVRCAEPMRKLKGRTEFQRGILFQDHGECWVRPTGSQGSGILSSMMAANCFIVLPPESAQVNAGEMVAVQPFEGLV